MRIAVLIAALVCGTETSAQSIDYHAVYDDWWDCLLSYERIAAGSSQPIDDLIPFVYAECIPEEKLVIRRLTRVLGSEARAWEFHAPLKDIQKRTSRVRIAEWRIRHDYGM